MCHLRPKGQFKLARGGILRFVIALAVSSLLFISGAKAQTEGKATYKAPCVKCHGEPGDGKGHAQMKIKPADLRSDAVQRKSDEELYNSIAFGLGHKEYAHAFAERGLSRKEIAAVVTFIRTFAKKK